jgi:hypothetical protein
MNQVIINWDYLFIQILLNESLVDQKTYRSDQIYKIDKIMENLWTESVIRICDI